MLIPAMAMASALDHIHRLPCWMHCAVRCGSIKNASAGPVWSHGQWRMTHAGPPALALTASCTDACCAFPLHEKEPAESVELRQVNYLNNLVEHDHRFIKRLVKPGLGFFSLETAG